MYSFEFLKDFPHVETNILCLKKRINLSGTPPKNRAIWKNRFSIFLFFFFLEAQPYKSLKTKEKKVFFSQRYGQKTSKKFFGPNFMNIARKK